METLAERIRNGSEVGAESPSYDDVLIWYDGLTAEVWELVNRISWDGVIHSVPDIVPRTKTHDTLREKLQRMSTTGLHRIVDISGVRIDAEMTLSQQDSVAAAVVSVFGNDNCTVKDLRDGAHSGYRGVHVHVKVRRALAEVQIRTSAQSMWANAYERLADIVGRDIRYDQDPPEDHPAAAIVQQLQNLSTEVIADIEEKEQWLASQPEIHGLSWATNIDLLPEDLVPAADSLLALKASILTALVDIEGDLHSLKRGMVAE